MKSIAITSDHTGMFVTSEDTLLFKALASLFQASFNIGTDELGSRDIILSYHELPVFKQTLEKDLSVKLAAMKPDKRAASKVHIFDKVYTVNIKNKDHHLIYSLGVILEWVEEEQAKQGNIYFKIHK